jgi:RNA polymerase sigma factor (sigma-70 family)
MQDVLTGFRPWLYKTAQQLLSPSSPDIEDLVQEGCIAMWQALKTHKESSGPLTAWLTLKARYRMLEVVTKKNWSGQPSRQHGRNPVQDLVPLSLDADHGGVTLADLLPAQEVIEDILDAYHHGQIYQAVSSLSPAQREYVYARFWKCMTTAEMKAEIFGYDPSALWNSPKNGAKRKLADALAGIA